MVFGGSATRAGSASPDVVIIGGGVVGCSIALRLAQRGLKVTVVERGQPGQEASSAAGGMIAPQGEMGELDDFYRLSLASRDLYSSFVAEVEQLSGHELGFRREGTLLVATDQKEAAELERIYARQPEPAATSQAIEHVSAAGLRELAPGVSTEILNALYVPGDQWVDNERLTPALAEAGRRLGVSFMTDTEVTKLSLSGRRVEQIELRSNAAHQGLGSQSSRPGEQISAGQFILAAGCWSGTLASSLGINLPVQPCRGQMLEFETAVEFPRVVRAGHIYLVPRAISRILIGSTSEYAGFEKAVTGEGMRRIIEGALRIAPFVGSLRFLRAWAGLRPDTADHRPILGYGEVENLVYATGHFRNGILLAPITAQLITELLVGGSASLPIDHYRPARFANLAAG